MRDILFRGKRVDNGDWVKGYYVYEVSKNIHWIFENSLGAINPGFKPRKNDYGLVNVEVIPETISQYTGLEDKNGNKIFEADLIKWSVVGEGETEFKVVWRNGGFYLENLKGEYPLFEDMSDFVKYNDEFEVIGNVHNKEVAK